MNSLLEELVEQTVNSAIKEVLSKMGLTATGKRKKRRKNPHLLRARAPLSAIILGNVRQLSAKKPQKPKPANRRIYRGLKSAYSPPKRDARPRAERIIAMRIGGSKYRPMHQDTASKTIIRIHKTAQRF